MFTATLTTLAAVAALNAQVVTANTTIAANTVSAPAAPAVTAPAVTAVAVRSNSAPRGVRIPGTFTVVADQNPLEGLEALYVVRSGDGG